MYFYMPMPTATRTNLRQLTSWILSTLIAVLFIFSAWAKIPELESFGWTIVETTFLNWTLAEWLARLLVGFELFLGIFYLFQFRIKSITFPWAITTILLFSIYLLVVIWQRGNDGNCGCFGEVIRMTPMESLVKNGILLILLFIQFKLSKPWALRFDAWMALALAIGALIIPFLLFPPESIYRSEADAPLKDPIPLSLLYETQKNTPPVVELRHGKHILLFLSLTCHFCRKAARRLEIMQREHPEIPFYAVLNGDSSQLKSFFDETRLKQIPYTLFNGPKEFIAMNGKASFPGIRWVEDTTVVRESNYLNLKETDILKWLKKNK